MDLREITGTWDYGSLPKNVRLGEHCFIERKASFLRYRSARPIGLVLGRNVIAYTWTEFNIEPTGSVEVGDDCILVGAVFMCAEHVLIGRRVVISYHVTIADSDFHPQNAELRRQDAIANAPGGDRSLRPRIESRPVVIDDDVSIGIGAIILKGVHIGAGARILPGAVIRHDVPPRMAAAGNPSRIVELGDE